MPTPPIRTLVVEDDDRLRGMLEALLNESPGYRCLQACATAEQASTVLARERPDVVLLDLELPKRSGMDLLEEVARKWPGLPVVILTVHAEPAWLFAAIRAGASGYLIKPAAPVAVLQAVAEARGGGAPMTGALARLLLRHFRETSVRKAEFETLSPRENEILRLISEGLLPEDVAKQLRISARTVGTHLHRVYAKLRVRTCAQAVTRYYQRAME